MKGKRRIMNDERRDDTTTAPGLQVYYVNEWVTLARLMGH